MATYSQQVIRSFLWQGGGQAVGQAITWVATIIVIRLLSPGDYGLMAMAFVFLGFFFLVSDLGIGAAAVQTEALNQQQLRGLFGVILVLNVAGFLLVLLAAPMVAQFFSEPRLTGVLQVLSVNFLLIATFVLPQSQLMRELDFRTKVRVDVTSMVLAAGASLIVAALGFGVWALVASSVVTHVVRAVGFNMARPSLMLPAFSWQPIGAMAQFGVIVTIDRILFFLYGQADMVIGGRVLGKEALGLYAVALSLAAIPMEKILPVITQVSFAAFSRIQHDRERVERNVLRAVQLVGLVCFPAFLGLAAVAGDLVPVVLGDGWLELIIPLQLLCLVLPLKALAAVLPPALFGIGRPGVNLANMAIVLCIMVVALMVGVRYGVVGLCLAWVFAYPPAFAIISWRSLRALGIPYYRFIGCSSFGAIASVAMALAVVGLGSALASFGGSVLRLGLMISFGAVLYVSLLLLFQRGQIRKLVSLLRN